MKFKLERSPEFLELCERLKTIENLDAAKAAAPPTFALDGDRRGRVFEYLLKFYSDKIAYSIGARPLSVALDSGPLAPYKLEERHGQIFLITPRRDFEFDAAYRFAESQLWILEGKIGKASLLRQKLIQVFGELMQKGLKITYAHVKPKELYDRIISSGGTPRFDKMNGILTYLPISYEKLERFPNV
jgi:hypothetical protein